MIKRLSIVFIVLFMLQPFANVAAFPSTIQVMEESYYYVYDGVESQGNGKLLTYKNDAFLPLSDVASMLGMTLYKNGDSYYLSGEPSLKMTNVVGPLAKDRTLKDPIRINPSIGAYAGVVIENGNMNPIYAKHATQKLYPASTLKLMTALIALENGNIKDTVTISANVKKVPHDSSKAGLEPGDQLTLEQLLYALMLPSGNDAAVAIAEHISGSERKFVELMNEKANELGLSNTRFTNAHGYHDPNQVTTALDLAKIAYEVSKYPTFMNVIKTPTYFATYKDIDGNTKTKKWKNSNQLIQQDSKYYSSAVIGGKTGYTSASRFNLVTYAKNGKNDYIVVLLRGERNGRYSDTKKLLQSAFHARALADKTDKVSRNVTSVSGDLYVNGNKVTDVTMFVSQGVTYVHADVLTKIVPSIQKVKRSDKQQMKASVNGSLLSFDHIEPTIQNGRMLVPMRAFFEAIGLQLKWDQQTKTIEGISDDTVISMKVDSNIASVNGKEITLDVPATVKNGRTLVPLRFISEATGATVDWGRGRVLYFY